MIKSHIIDHEVQIIHQIIYISDRTNRLYILFKVR